MLLPLAGSATPGRAPCASGGSFGGGDTPDARPSSGGTPKRTTARRTVESPKGPTRLSARQFREKFDRLKAAGGDVLGLPIREFFAAFGAPDEKMKVGGEWIWARYHLSDGIGVATFVGEFRKFVFSVDASTHEEIAQQKEERRLEQIRSEEEARQREADRQRREEEQVVATKSPGTLS